MAAVKLGVSRQVVIPKKIFDQLRLAPGDYLEVDVEDGRVVMTPKVLVEKAIERRIAEGLADLKKGNVHGPFDTAQDAIHHLRRSRKGKRR